MSHWRSGTFWASAVFGWFVTMIALAFGICIFGSEDMTTAEGIVVNVAHQLLSLVAGYAHGRRQFEKLHKRKQIGFPVITKGAGDSGGQADDGTCGDAGGSGDI